MRVFFSSTRRVALSSFLAGALLFALWACVTNPYSGQSQFLLTSEAQEMDLGREAYAEMAGADSAKLITDPAWFDPLQRVGEAIAAAADKPEFEWEFRLIDDPGMVNAWCLPGGKIAFYTGIYPILLDEAGMAIVMGHEVSHALLRHGGQRMSSGMLTEAALGIGAVALQNNENREAILGALGMGAQVGIILPYSRSHESEADELGLRLAAMAGYDPEAAIGVWERMAALGSGGPEFLSTHPAPENRIEKMREWMPEAKRLYEASQKKRNSLLPKL